MVLFIQRHGEEPKEYRLANVDDFDVLLKRYPSLVHQVLLCRNVQDAAQKVVEYLNSGQVSAWLEGEDLEKGENGDWFTEGYEIKPIYTPSGSNNLTGMHAYGPDAKLVGFVDFDNHGTHLEPKNVEVHNEHQRKGLASAMYGQAESITGLKIHPSSDRSRAAKKLWAQPNRPFGKSEGLEKVTPKQAMATIGMGAALMGSPTKESKPLELPMRQPASVHPESTMETTPFGQNPEDSFLWNIKQIESSNGRNLNHPTMHSGMHQGESAVGRFGLMPKTIKDIAHRMKGLGHSAPEVDYISHLPDLGIKEYLSAKPDVELNMARFLARHILQRHKGDEQRAAYSWLNGHNLHSHDISDEKLKAHPYVQKYLQYKTKNPFLKQIQSISMNKAEEKDPIKVDEFKDKLRAWFKYRDNKESEKEIDMHDNTWVPDPGRQRDDNKYEQPDAKELVRDYVIARKK